MLFFLAPPIGLPLAMVQDQGRQTQEIGGLQVSYDRQVEIDTEKGTIVFQGSVRAQYDLTVVSSDTLTLDYKNNVGTASGGVTLTDPEAFLSTETLEFNWKEKTGFAKNIYVQVGNMRIRGELLTITPEMWRIDRARATLSRKANPQYEIKARVVRIQPGKYGIAKHVSLDLFGLGLGTAPEMRFDLDPRIDGFNLPSIAEKKGVGLGISWASGFLLNDNTVLGATWGSFPSRLPNYGVSVTLMNADPDKTFRQLKPMDDLKEQTGDGWFDNVSVAGPRNETAAISSPRLLYMVASKWNTSTIARPDPSDTVSKAYEVVVESSGRVEGFGVRMATRVQSIREASESPFVDRVVSHLTVQSPTLYLSHRVGLQARADVFGSLSSNETFSWTRGQVGLLWSPTDGVTLGVAYSDSRSYGTPDFGFDRRLYDRAVHARLDYVRGPYTFRYLVKYDPTTSQIFDREWEVALVMEAFEPFAVFRENPSDYRIGVRFRIDDFRGRLQRRNQSRTIDRPF